jgi:hypothetical protein
MHCLGLSIPDSTGLGLHLKELAQQMPGRYDLHEPSRTLSTLSEYDHLHRLFRLCHAHVSRNIKTTHVSENVKNKMWSLVCVEHPDFDGTLREIEQEGGKPGAGMYISFLVRNETTNFLVVDWAQDKRRSKFALEGMCWARSFIPKLVWQLGDATSNVIEGLHSDVNKERIACSLVGGVHRGHHFDNLKLKTLDVSFIYFVWFSYVH